MLHQVTLTPTQQAAKDVRERLKALRAPPKKQEIPITDLSPEAQMVALALEPVKPLKPERQLLPRVDLPQEEDRPKSLLELRLEQLEYAVFGLKVPESSPRKVGVRQIVRVVAKHFQVQPSDIYSCRRTQDIVTPRHVAMYLAKKLTGYSYPFIGYHMGGRDHTTVIFGVRKIARLLPRNPDLAEQVDQIRAALGPVEAE